MKENFLDAAMLALVPVALELVGNSRKGDPNKIPEYAARLAFLTAKALEELRNKQC
jgi:hypothetical protein